MQTVTLWPSETEEETILSAPMEMHLQIPVPHSAVARTLSQLPRVVTASQQIEMKMPHLRMQHQKCSREHRLSREQTDPVKMEAWSNRMVPWGVFLYRRLPLPPLLSQTPRDWPDTTFPPPCPRPLLLLHFSHSAVSIVTSTPPCAAPVDSRSAPSSRIMAQAQGPSPAASLLAHTLTPILLTRPPLSITIITSTGKSISKARHMHQESGMTLNDLIISYFSASLIWHIWPKHQPSVWATDLIVFQ